MSSDANEFDDEQLQNCGEEEEVRSAMAASSSCISGHHEIHSNSSSDDCSQSEISLCDDGGSEMEEGEGHHILGHLGQGAEDDADSLGKSGESYDDEEEAAYSI